MPIINCILYYYIPLRRVSVAVYALITQCCILKFIFVEFNILTKKLCDDIINSMQKMQQPSVS